MPTYASVTAVGDSFTAGSGGVPSYAIGVAANWSATLDNQGQSGGCLQTVTAQYAIYDNYANDTGASSAEAAIFAFGFNDARYNGVDTSITVANYTALYESYMRRACVKFGIDKVYIATPWYISDVGLATGGGVNFQGRTRAHFETYVSAALAVAQKFGCNYRDFYADGVPATTLDDIHPDTTARDIIVANFELTTTNPDTPSVLAPTNPDDYTIRVPAGCTCYLIEGDVETLLTVGDHITSPGLNELAWTDGGGYVFTSMNVSGDQTALNVTPADNTGFTVNSATPESIDLTGTTSRNNYTYDWSGVTQNEVVFMQITTASALRIIIRENSALDLGGGTNSTIFDQTLNGTIIVRTDRLLTTKYFGFLTLAAGSFQVNFFKVGVTDQTKLDAIPAGVGNFILNSWSDNSLSLESLGTATYAFDYTAVAIGEPIKLDINTGSSIRVIVREAADTSFLTNATSLYDQTITGSASLELERTTAEQYFGFRLIGAGDFDVTNFLVGSASSTSSFGGLHLGIGIGI